MDENHQDKTGNKQIATKVRYSKPPSSPKDQKKLDRLREQLSDRGDKVTEEYSDTGQLSKVSGEHPPKKTWWDWLQLLIIPFLIFSLGIVFTWKQNQTSLQVAQSNRDKDLQIAKDTQEEATLKAYLDDMSTLILDKKLGSQAPADKVASVNAAVVARAKTLSVLRRLTDVQRKARVLQFLYEAHLIGYIYFPPGGGTGTRIESIINLDGADLSRADLIFADLRGADLSRANLYGAILFDANLSRADLSGAFLSGANFMQANLDKTILKGALYNTKEILLKDEHGEIYGKLPPTQWPQGFNPKTAGAREAYM